MEPTFCVQCGGKLAGGQPFCPSCGQKAPALTGSDSSPPVSGPRVLKMPDGYPDIDLTVYGGMGQQAIEKINSLNGTERIAWVQAGQPYILSWTAGDFLTWLQRSTGTTSQAQPASPSPYSPTSPLAYPARRTNGYAITGFVLSLSSIALAFAFNPFIVVVSAIVFSSIGISASEKLRVSTGVASGRGLAIAGLVISVILAGMIFIDLLWYF